MFVEVSSTVTGQNKYCSWSHPIVGMFIEPSNLKLVESVGLRLLLYSGKVSIEI